MPPAPGAAGGGGGGGQEEGSIAIIWGVVGLFVLLGIVWYLFKVQIITGYLLLKFWELKALSFFTDNARILELVYYIQSANAASLNFERMITIGQMVGSYLRIPFTVLLIALAIVVYFSNSIRKFKTTYSMKTLALSEKNNWPQITPVLGLDLVSKDIDTGPWAMAMSPLQFCKKYNLIESRLRPRSENVSSRDPHRYETILKRGEAAKIFALQLGSRWEGIHKLPPYAKALFAVFAARINGDTQAAAKLILQLNRSCKTQFNYSGVDALLKKHANSKLVNKIVNNHAYVLTVMAGMLVAARADGVQATADFLWLKPLDRRFWYMLNTMGRQTPFVESAGPYAHWLAEREAGRRLITPMVENATNAMEGALKSIIYNPEEEENK